MQGKGNRGFVDFNARRKLSRIRKVLLVGSGKGGVGKSLVACGLGLLLSEAGYKTAILDVDIHGASVPNYLGVGPPLKSSSKGLVPKEVGKLKVMSVALLTGDNPVPTRGIAKQRLLTELFALTDWGALDYLVVDLPPSTGDELLTAFDLFVGRATLILVTTPSRSALKVVSRLRRLATSEEVPVAGVVGNMAFARVGKDRIFPFGRADAKSIRTALDTRLLVEVPLEPKVNTSDLRSVLRSGGEFSEVFNKLARMIAQS